MDIPKVRIAVVMLAGLALAAGPALANPIPANGVFVHVQPLASDFCTNNPITSCDDVVQFTTETGLLEFDLFLFSAFPDVPVYRFQTNLHWPAGWVLTGWEICGGGDGVFSPTGDGAFVDITWAHCPPFDGDHFLIARVVLDVSGPGQFSGDVVTPVWVNCPPDDLWEDQAVFIEATAGVECSYCYTGCDWTHPCRPELTPGELYLEVEQGESIQEMLLAEIHGTEFPCDVEFPTSEPWMTAEGVWTGPMSIDVTLTVDATDMEVGSYEGWLRAESDCVGCTKVFLEVLPAAQGVPDEDDLPEDSDRAVSWGKIKALYK